jgi:hypothetical protein
MNGFAFFLTMCFALPILLFVLDRILRITIEPLGDAWFDRQGEKYQPMTDEEFVARCRPGTRPETALEVRSIIADITNIPVEQIHPDHTFVDDLGLG